MEDRDLEYEDRVCYCSLVRLSRSGKFCTNIKFEIRPKTIIDASIHVPDGICPSLPIGDYGNVDMKD
ncbi:hypothetical protein L484_017367 [Morus notabilis]|uniref:Uncharacterized protein n=1 Tax=Morus notabilis TaxID=981085 RepID=W9R507_9ROSA|nr:hypothetical protein L484_017367 [Morus notabilis]